MAYNGISPYLYKNSISTVDTFDDISGSFNGSATVFNITVSGASYTRLTAKACLIVLGGVVQEAGIDYTINAGQITFTTAPVSGLTFEGRHLFGLNGVDTPTSGSVYPSTLSAGGPSWDTSGNVSVSGNLTVNGSTTTINSTTLSIDDKNIVIADGVSTLANLDTAGIDFGSTNVRLRYNYNGGTNSGLSIEGTNVGIGINNPQDKLDVSGAIIVRNPLQAHQTSCGVLERNGDKIALRAYGASAGSGFLAFNVGGGNNLQDTEAVRITSTGNVGIGTDNPSNRMHLYSTTDSAELLQLEIGNQPANSEKGKIIWRGTQSNGQSAKLAILGSTAVANWGGELFFSTKPANGTPNDTVIERLRITSTGNVGIGTTNPTVQTHFYAPSQNSNIELLRLSGGNRTADSFETGFRVSTETTSANSNRHLRLICNGQNGFSFQPFETSTGNAATDRSILICPSGGNVGIGTTNPSNRLEIAYTSDSDGFVINNTSRGGRWIQATSGTDAEDFYIARFDSGATMRRTLVAGTNVFQILTGNVNSTTARVHVDSTGNVGIGTTNPGAKLHVSNGSAIISNPNPGASGSVLLVTDDGTATTVTGAATLRVANDGSGSNFAVFEASSSVSNFVITNAGGVGIGTSNPQAKLDVNGGNARFGRSGISILVRNSLANPAGATIPATFVACTTDGGANLATTYWTQNYGAAQAGSCLGAFTAADTYVSPSSNVAYGATIYGIVGRY